MKGWLYIPGLLYVVFWASFCYGQEPVQKNHVKDFYFDEKGNLYAPVKKPVFVSLSFDSVPESGITLNQNTISAKGEMHFSEGKNVFCNPSALTKISGSQTKVCYTIIGDGSPPEMEIDFTGTTAFFRNDTGFYGENLKINLQATDKWSGVSNIFVSLNNTEYARLNEVVWNFLDGGYNLLYYAVDNVGNVSTVFKQYFMVDVSPPVTRNLKQGTGHENFYPASSQIILSASDNLSGIKSITYSIDSGKDVEYTGPVDLSGLFNGSHTLTYFSEDNTGNIEQTKTYTFVYDTIPPILDITVVGTKYKREKTVFVSGQPQISIQGKDSLSGLDKIMYRIDSKEVTEYEKPFYLTDKKGMHQIRFYAFDKVNNKTREKVQKVYIDNTHPDTYHKLSEQTFRNNDTLIAPVGIELKLSPVDMESGINETRFSINDQPDSIYRTDIKLDQTGLYNISYYSTDRVDNREPSKQLWLRVRDIDLAEKAGEPTQHNKEWIVKKDVGLSGPKDHPFYIRISDSPDDNATSFLVHFEENGQRKPFVFSTQGENEISINLGNTLQSFTLDVDGMPPTSDIQYKNAVHSVQHGKHFYGQGLEVVLSAKDNVRGISSGLESIFYSINASDFAEYQEPLKVFGMEQLYNLRFYAVDSVKNVEQFQKVDFSVDISPPRTLPAFERSAFGNFISAKSVITLSSDDNLSGIKGTYYFFDEEKEKVYSRFVPGNVLRDLNEGRHILTYYAVDNVDNIEEKKSLEVIVDHTPPEIDLEYSGIHFSRGGTMYLSPATSVKAEAWEESTEIKSFEYTINNGERVACNSSLTIPETQGQYRITLYASDMVDNVQKKSYTFYRDTKSPKSTISFVGPVFNDIDKKYISKKTKIIVKSSDNASGVKSVLFGTSPQRMYGYKNAVTLDGNGRRFLYYYARDNVGNREKRNQAEVYLDNKPPTIEISYNSSGKENGIDVITPYSTVYIMANDEVALEAIFYSINDGEQQVYRMPISNFQVGETITITAHAKDRLNNSATKTVKLIVK